MAEEEIDIENEAVAIEDVAEDLQKKKDEIVSKDPVDITKIRQKYGDS